VNFKEAIVIEEATDEAVFEEHRSHLLSVAYRMLGSVAEAEDVVQEAWLRWDRADRAEVNDPRGYLVRITTRLALDRLRRLKVRREEYNGPWLPEPVASVPDPAEVVEIAESVSLALLIVLETLSPLERAVYVLREAFAYSHAEIARILDRSEPTVRQVAHRARQHVDARRPRFDTDEETSRRVTERFLAACANGDLDALLGVLAPDVVLVGDGGDKAKAPRRPILGSDKVSRFLLAIWDEGAGAANVRVLVTRVNGDPGIVATEADDPIGAVVLDVTNGLVQTIYMVVNPDKLGGVRVGSSPAIG
jgi:RNA polymerase sigma-70 factor, ECF subfamily